MKGEDINNYIAEFEELVRMAGYRFDIPQTIETFTEGLPTGLYQKVLKFNRPHTYEQWKQVAIDQQQTYIHMKARLQAHQGNTTPRQNRSGWAPRGQLTDPNAMDMSARRTHGRIAGSEEVDPHTMRGGFIPRGRYTPQGGFIQGQRRMSNLSEVECYTCHKKGHLSRNCPQHTWNQ